MRGWVGCSVVLSYLLCLYPISHVYLQHINNPKDLNNFCLQSDHNIMYIQQLEHKK